MESTVYWELGSLGFPRFVARLPGQIVSLLCDLPRHGFSRGREAGGAFYPLSVCPCLPVTHGTLCWVQAILCFLAHIPAWDHLPCQAELGRAVLYNTSPQCWGHAFEAWFSVSIYRLHPHWLHPVIHLICAFWTKGSLRLRLSLTVCCYFWYPV